MSTSPSAGVSVLGGRGLESSSDVVETLETSSTSSFFADTIFMKKLYIDLQNERWCGVRKHGTLTAGPKQRDTACNNMPTAAVRSSSQVYPQSHRRVEAVISPNAARYHAKHARDIHAKSSLYPRDNVLLQTTQSYVS